LFLDGKSSATGIWSEKKMTLADRMAKTVEIVATDQDQQNPWIIWTDTNAEADALKALLPTNGVVEVRGSDKLAEKERKLNAFSSGEARIIITKPEIAGLGLNWQHCSNMLFVGATFSYERVHQALRRSYRFRQTREVNAHLVVAETENNVLTTLRQKQTAFQEMQAAMNQAQKEHGLFGGGNRRELADYQPKMKMLVPQWCRSKSA
jgi:superfamily II DNA or RNA helicase